MSIQKCQSAQSNCLESKLTFVLLIAVCSLSLASFPKCGQAQDGFYQALSPSGMDTLVGPIALYPDPLLSQVLPASTFPSQITSAAQWVQNNSDQAQIDFQPWDNTVIAVAHYPSVINYMSEQIGWTTQLGQAYLNQQSDVFSSVQRLRTAAQLNGNLITTAQQNVVTQGNYIQILPAQSSVIYVPQYDPTVIYTQPATSAAVPLMAFGAGLAMGSAMSSTTVNWYSNSVTAYTNSGGAIYKGASTGWGQAYYGAGPHGYGEGVTASGTGAYGNSWNSAAVAGRTWNGGAYAGTANTNQWENGAKTGSYSTAAAGPYGGSSQSHGWGYQNGDNSAGAFSKTGSTDNGAFSVSGSGWKDSDGSGGSVTASGVNKEGDYASKTWTDSDGNVSSTSHSGNAFSGSSNSSWSNSFADRGSYSRSSFGGGDGYGGGGFGGGGFGGGGFGGGGGRFGGFRR